ncbi:MAG: thiamine phosphate synthase [Ignavibacteriae bacterium]|nr:thiamine phosphate synthase [Ignavibacteriota bacterium]MCB9217381.1 thiamine phosphate synthase [Ignavibacteria bacterium]
MSESVGSDLPFRVIAILQDSQPAEEILQLCEDVPTVGVGVMLRDADHSPNVVQNLAKSLLANTLPQNLTLITNGCSVEEIGWRHLTSAELRRKEKPVSPFGASAHNYAEAQLAEQFGASYITCSPVFPTPSKPKLGSIGLIELGQYNNLVGIPLFALGGITTVDRVKECLDAGCWGVAGISFARNSTLFREILSLFS